MSKKPEPEEIEPAGELIVLPTMNIIKIDEVPEFFNNVRIKSNDDVKRLKRFDKFARSSFEYQKYMRYLKQNLNMNRCSFLSGITTNLGGIRIEIHHSPFTLFDITSAVATRQLEEHGYADEFDVGDEVMKLHYQNLVGLIPVSPTVHELIHSESIDVHPRLTYGYWKIFIARYKDHFSNEMLLKCKELEAWDRVQEVKVPDILKVKYTMLEYAGIPMYKEHDLNNMKLLESELQKNESACETQVDILPT